MVQNNSVCVRGIGRKGKGSTESTLGGGEGEESTQLFHPTGTISFTMAIKALISTFLMPDFSLLYRSLVA